MVGWLTKDPYELHTNLQNQDLYDVVFTTERSAVPRCQPGKAKFLPMRASKSLCYYPVRDSCMYDVCIAGTAWPERVDWFRKLVKSYRVSSGNSFFIGPRGDSTVYIS